MSVFFLANALIDNLLQDFATRRRRRRTNTNGHKYGSLNSNNKDSARCLGDPNYSILNLVNFSDTERRKFEYHFRWTFRSILYDGRNRRKH